MKNSGYIKLIASLWMVGSLVVFLFILPPAWSSFYASICSTFFAILLAGIGEIVENLEKIADIQQKIMEEIIDATK